MFQALGIGKKTSSCEQEVLSPEEKEARKEAMRKAADERSQQWDRKFGANKKLPPSNSSKEKKTVVLEDPIPSSSQIQNPETLRVVEATKQLEVNIEQQLGYSPFRPHMSFTGNGAVSAALASSSKDDSDSTYKSSSQSYVDEDTMVQLDEALAMMLSLGESDQERVNVAVQTVLKMLHNLHTNPTEVKFRSIRLANKAFQNKVCAVPGGVELCLAAGFLLQGEENTEDAMLCHPMTPPTVQSLAYTMARLQELVGFQS